MSMTDSVRLCEDLNVKLEREEAEEEVDYTEFENEMRSWQEHDGDDQVNNDVGAAGDNNVSIEPNGDGCDSTHQTSEAFAASNLDDAEILAWHLSLAGQASNLTAEHEKMAELLALQKQCELKESKLRCELFTWQKDRLMTQKWRDKLLSDKSSEIEAATLEMKDLISKLEKANPSWRNKVRFAEMF